MHWLSLCGCLRRALNPLQQMSLAIGISQDCLRSAVPHLQELLILEKSHAPQILM